MTMKTLLAGGLAAVSLTMTGAAALAQQPTSPAPTPHGPRAARGDADGDGRVSRAEFVDGRLARLVAADADRDGAVTPEERRAAMQAHRTERAADRFARLDADGNGRLSPEEFAARPDRLEGRRPHRGERARRAMNGNGAPVVIAEARTKAEDAFTRLDVDRDGYLSADERRAGMERMHERRRERREVRDAARAAEASPSAPASE